MSHPYLAFLGAAAALALEPADIAAQTPPQTNKPSTAANSAKAAKSWTAPRTADGQPDLEGVWSSATLTPFERPREFAGKEFFTEAEAAAYAQKIIEQSNRDRRGATPEED